MADSTPEGRRIRRPATTAAVSIAAAFALTATGGVAGAAAAPRPDFPTWQEVQAAKHNEAAKKAEIAKLEKIVGELKRKADALAKISLIKAEDAALAQSDLDAAEAKVARLGTQLTDAQQRADDSSRLAASLIARLARTGGGDATLGLAFASRADADRLLSRLGTMSKLSESSAALVEKAVFDQRAVESLSDQAALAAAERKKLSDAADATLAEAEKAAAEVEAEVASQSASQSVLYAQLASLKGTTAALEQSYADGIEWENEHKVDDPPPPTSHDPSDPPGPSDPNPPAPVGSAVQGAINYAKAQLGERYVLGGMGPSVWDCSGLTKAAYASVGVYIGPHSSTDQYNYMRAQGRLVAIGDIEAGDLLFYSDGGSASVARKYHVTIYLGNGQMIEAPNPSAKVRIVNVRKSDLVPYAGRPTG